MPKPVTAPPSVVAGLLNPISPKPRNPGGRPKGSKTRPDAPSKLARQAKLSQAATFPATPKPVATETRPDTELFGTPPKFDDPPAGETPGADPETETETPGAAPEVETPQQQAESHMALSTVIWDSIVGILSMLVGPFWQPRKMGGNAAAGEITYDERQMVLDAFCKYFVHVGMVVMSPVQELWLAIGAYSSPRLILTLMWLKQKMAKKPKNITPEPVAGDNRFAETAPPAANPPKSENNAL